MKTLFTLVLLLALTLGATAAESLRLWSGTSTDRGATNSFCVVSVNSWNAGTPVITYYNTTSDKAGSYMTFYTASEPTTVSATLTNLLYIPVLRTNGFAAGDVFVVRHLDDDSYERLHVLARGPSGLTNGYPLIKTCTVGDQVWKVTAAGKIAVGNTTVTATGDTIYAGQKGKPLLVEVDSTSAGQINALTARYEEPVK